MLCLTHYSVTVSQMLVFFAEFFLCLNWAPVAAILLVRPQGVFVIILLISPYKNFQYEKFTCDQQLPFVYNVFKVVWLGSKQQHFTLMWS